MISLEIGSRVWEPTLAADDDITVLRRFNGAPTLGLFTAAGQRYLFWQALGYVTDAFSLWVYVPVGELDERETARLPYGIVFDSPSERMALAALAQHNRLLFYHEWHIQPNMDLGELLRDLIHSLLVATETADRLEMPPDQYETLSAAVEAM